MKHSASFNGPNLEARTGFQGKGGSSRVAFSDVYWHIYIDIYIFYIIYIHICIYVFFEETTKYQEVRMQYA